MITNVQNARTFISVSLTPGFRGTQFEKHWHKFSFSAEKHQETPKLMLRSSSSDCIKKTGNSRNVVFSFV